MNIGQVIRILRLQRGLTQEELALGAQVATSNVSRIENGQRQPSQDLLRRLARILETPVSRIHAMSEEGLFPRDIENDADLKDLSFMDFGVMADISPLELEPPADSALEEPEEAPLTAEVLALLKYFQRLTPENKTLALEHIKLLNRLQRDE